MDHGFRVDLLSNNLGITGDWGLNNFEKPIGLQAPSGKTAIPTEL